ncbi:hypothetical protein ACS0TY_007854 [Phlomoides rotata]
MANPSRESCSRLIIIGVAFLFMIKGVVAADETVFDIMSYDAKADGQTDDAMAFIQAFREACDATGPTRVTVPVGKVFSMSEIVFQGPCNAGPTITIEINGNLSALLIDKVDGIKVTGHGTFNGHGQSVWQYADGTETNRLPVSLLFQEVHNSEISNLNFIDSMGFHTKVTDSINVLITNLTITAPDNSPNTDGIHLTNNTNVKITDSVIGTGDDCVSIGDGNVDLLITRVFCGPGHGLSIGSLGKREGETSVSGVTISNCTLTKTTNGARIKSYHSSPRLDCTKIVYQDIVMNEVKNPIIIDQHYDSKKLSTQSSVKISDVKFVNIKGTTISRNPILLKCSSLFPCENIELGDINLVPVTPLKTFAAACSSAKFKVNGVVNPPMPLACK